VGRLDDISNEGLQVIKDIVAIFVIHDIETKIIAASIRTPMHVLDCAKAGADIATIPFGVLKKMFQHPLTDKGIAQFKKDWENAKK
jgi:transaldolase